MVIARRLVNLMAGTTLQCRDYILKSVDPRIGEQEKVSLRSTSFLSARLFDGQAKPVVARLEDSAQDFLLQKSIKAMAAAIQQLAKSTPRTQQKPPFQETSHQGSETFQVCVHPSTNIPLLNPDKTPPLRLETKVPNPQIGMPNQPDGTSLRVVHESDYPLPPPPPPPPTPCPQVGGCLQDFAQAWSARGASPWIVSILQEGYHLEFESPPPLSCMTSVVTASLDPR